MAAGVYTSRSLVGTSHSLVGTSHSLVGTSHSLDGTSCSPADTSPSPIVAGVALGGKGWLVVQLFHYTKIGGSLYLLLVSEESHTSHAPIIPRATPATIGDQTV